MPLTFSDIGCVVMCWEEGGQGGGDSSANTASGWGTHPLVTGYKLYLLEL
jgi:hypothetical protein